MVKSTISLTVLRPAKHRREHKAWIRWMECAVDLANRFYEEAGKDDPFDYGETASVGFLATAAAKAGYLSLPEFAVSKLHASDRRKRSRGRSDLWVQTDASSDWWFEFKQHFVGRGSDNDIRRKWEKAEACANQVRLNGTCVAALVVSFGFLKRERPQNLKAAREAISRFTEKRQFACRISGNDNEPETYIFFDIV